MFFAIQETPYDLKWRMFGIHVRVHPLFWLIAAILAWDYLRVFGIPAFLVVIACVFVSILIHELGHVIVGNSFGSHGHIVLWAFGGLAIGSTQLDNRWKRIAVTFAGPGIQLILYGLLRLADPYIPRPEDFEARVLVEVAVGEMLWINLFWALLNLLPIFPLDGGQIARDLFTWFTPRNGVRFSLQLSIGLSLLLAVHAFAAERTGQSIPYLPVGVGPAIFFLMFAGVGFQTLQAENERTRWFDPWDHERW
ncbi:MAG: site-2 protease family protein [Planctomycetes bacterium]|nr:site-2 protease family protein [Planctomycetota bacterium]